MKKRTKTEPKETRIAEPINSGALPSFDSEEKPKPKRTYKKRSTVTQDSADE